MSVAAVTGGYEATIVINKLRFKKLGQTYPINPDIFLKNQGKKISEYSGSE